MWSTVLVVALLGGFNPVRLGITLLVISRERPIPNLIVYWCGCVLASFLFLLVPLFLLHATTLMGSFAEDLAIPSTEASSTARQFQVVLGVLVLTTATVMTIRAQRRRRASVIQPAGVASSAAQNTDWPSPADSQLPEGAAGNPAASPFRRLIRRGRRAWDDGALWVSFVIGIGTGPGIDGALYVLALIVPSGAAVASQFAAAIVFIVVMLGIVEITLVSYWIAPAKTQALVQVLHDWAQAHGRIVVIAMLVVIGLAMLNAGFSII